MYGMRVTENAIFRNIWGVTPCLGIPGNVLFVIVQRCVGLSFVFSHAENLDLTDLV